MDRGGETQSFDGKDFKYHLHWELYSLHQQVHPIVGFCRSGELFGILGINDIKAAMLRTLCGITEKSKDSNVTLFANGKVSTSAWSKSSYLCPGDDNILYSNLTVIETLLFSSDLRVAHVHDEISALRLLTAMELDHISETRISSLTAWQRRMVVFATEIVAGQDLIFFDRPTLDLDATSALACVTALQRVARTGVLIAITSDFLSFREYAILDRIQLLTNVGSIFFGAGARAISFFEQFGRTPSPGASIPDFLFYLVDDINSGFLDGGNIIKANVAQSKNICKHVDNYIKRSMNRKEDDSFIVPNAFNGGIMREKDRHSHGRRSASGRHVISDRNVVVQSIFDSLDWIRQCRCLDVEDEDMCSQPVVSKQFWWCLWRATAIRARNMNHLTGLLGLIGIVMPLGLVAVFFGAVSDETELGILNYCLLLTILPFCISLFGVIWNEDDVQDRIVFSFERSRSYYLASHFPIAAIIADVFIFKLVPVVTACIILIPLLSLHNSFTAVVRLLHSLFLVTVVSTCLSKAVFNIMAYSSTSKHERHNGSNYNSVGTSIAAKAALVSVFWLTIQLLYSGMFECFGSDAGPSGEKNFLQVILSNMSMFRWVCGALYWNEIERLNLSEIESSSLICLRQQVIEPGDAFACLWLTAAGYMMLSTVVSIIFHK